MPSQTGCVTRVSKSASFEPLARTELSVGVTGPLWLRGELNQRGSTLTNFQCAPLPSFGAYRRGIRPRVSPASVPFQGSDGSLRSIGTPVFGLLGDFSFDKEVADRHTECISDVDQAFIEDAAFAVFDVN
jgi:hypothetical protein